ncbi:unnamed protein product [Phaedon cochleariae]|uniref:Uncharacterized protein n=1 Tax=Phaedon cochleariae TaxID=80249 RepID=A0A9N9SPS2_PHACE|nr:unnamed protein product [Phaedon cochleariae]
MEKLKRELELINRDSIEIESSLNLQIDEQQETINSLKNLIKTLQKQKDEIEVNADKNTCSIIPMTHTDKSTKTEYGTDNIQRPRGVVKGIMTDIEGNKIDCSVQTTEIDDSEAKQEREAVGHESIKSKKFKGNTNDVKQQRNKNVREYFVKKLRDSVKRNKSSQNHWKVENIAMNSVIAKTSDDNNSRTRTSNIIHLSTEINENISESDELILNGSNPQENDTGNTTDEHEIYIPLQKPVNSGNDLPVETKHQEAQDETKLDHILVLGDEYANGFSPVLDRFIGQAIGARQALASRLTAGAGTIRRDSVARRERDYESNSLGMAFDLNTLFEHIDAILIYQGDLLKFAENLFQTHLQLTIKKSEIDNAYLISQSQEKPRVIAVRFDSFLIKIQVLKNCHLLKKTSIVIAEDLGLEDRQEKKLLIQRMRKEKENNQKAHIKGGKLFINSVGDTYKELLEEKNKKSEGENWSENQQSSNSTCTGNRKADSQEKRKKREEPRTIASNKSTNKLYEIIIT